jgi:peptidoglycan/LPS O-acetylase OafA/YrhL
MQKLPNLNPLRFFLASIVILFHVPQLSKNQGLASYNDLPIFQRGSEAVYMFFVLSGFLIIRLIYQAKQENRFSIKNFYMRRVLRILPLYYLIVVFGFLFYNLFLPAVGMEYPRNYDFLTGILMTTFFLPNVFISYEPGGILEILWSIGIEEQFYLMIAPLLFFLNKKHILKVLIVLVVTYFAIFNLDSLEVLRKYRFVYFFMLSGGIIAILEEKGYLGLLKKSKFFSIIVIVITFIIFFTDWLHSEDTFLYYFRTLLSFTFFIYVLAHANFGVIIKNKALDYLGTISYGMYMYHAIALNIVVFIFVKIDNHIHIPDILMIGLLYFFTFALTIFMSHISYKYYEKYFLDMKDRYRKKSQTEIPS